MKTSATLKMIRVLLLVALSVPAQQAFAQTQAPNGVTGTDPVPPPRVTTSAPTFTTLTFSLLKLLNLA